MDKNIAHAVARAITDLKSYPGGESLLDVVARERCFIAPYVLADGEEGVLIDLKTPMGNYLWCWETYKRHTVECVSDWECRAEIYKC